MLDIIEFEKYVPREFNKKNVTFNKIARSVEYLHAKLKSVSYMIHKFKRLFFFSFIPSYVSWQTTVAQMLYLMKEHRGNPLGNLISFSEKLPLTYWLMRLSGLCIKKKTH